MMNHQKIYHTLIKKKINNFYKANFKAQQKKQIYNNNNNNYNKININILSQTIKNYNNNMLIKMKI